MSPCNLRSLLIAAIVISNCITWTASKHHYTHSVSGHRTRHRRQGQGLYLPSSYVIPEGEGEGWGEWGKVSPCSRTCGGGVASQKRICLQIGPDGQPQCTGGDTKYFSCETQDCPPGSPDFRAAQCAEFNDVDFRGFKYSWVPYTKTPNPCELNCMPRGERFYYRYKPKVIDGTKCNEDSLDVCVNGRCQPLGCDMMIGSNARADKCGECRGNGSNCYTNSGFLDSKDYIMGYNDILFIPQGSTSIVIEEIAPSDNYLALRASKNGTYYLNGHYKIEFPRTLEIAGALWTYERSQLGFMAPDKLRSLGPTNEPLYLLLLQQSDNVGIRYEYSVPRNTSPPIDKQYNWVHDVFTPCSVSCGGGFQSRNVTCRSSQELEVVEDELCDEGLKPVSNQSCSTDPCPAQWVELPWSECTKNCGEGGLRKRVVECQKTISNGVASIIPDKECIETLGPKPKVFEECNQDFPCPTWFVGSWKPCDKLCGSGNQTRQVVCHQKIDGRVKVLDEKECEDEKPETNKSCMLEPCSGVDWMTSEWIGCDSCLSKVRTRSAICVTNQSEIINDTYCAYHKKPVTEEPCTEEKNCTYMWYATQWGNCSVKCGEGNQTRKVFCGLFDEGSVQMVEDEKCASLEKYPDTKPCKIPKEKCPAQWFGGPWEKCTKDFKGKQTRMVVCLDSNGQSGECKGHDILDPTRSCNKSSDEAAVDVKTTPKVDDDSDDDYCDEDDSDYEEEGLEEDLILTTVLGDEPTYSDSTEDTLSDLEGSGSSEISDFTSTGTGFTKNLADTNATGTGETSSLEYDDSTEYTITNATIDANATGTTSGTGETELDTSSTVASSPSDTNVTSSLNTTESSTLASSTSESNVTVSSIDLPGTEDTNTTGLDTSTSNAITESSSGTSSSTESSVTEETSDVNATTSSATGSTEPTATDVSGTNSVTEASSSVARDESTSNTTESSTASGTSDVNVTTPLDATGSTESTGTADVNATNTDIETSTIMTSEGTTSNSSESSTVSNTTGSIDVNATTPSDITDATNTSSTDVKATDKDTSTDVTSEGTTSISIESSTVTPSNTTDSTEPTGTEITNTTEGESSTSVSITTEGTTSNETESSESSTVFNTTESLSSSGTTESTVSGETNTTDEETATSTAITIEGTTSNDTESTTASDTTSSEVSNTTDSSGLTESTTGNSVTSDKETTSNTTETSTVSDISSTESNVTESLNATGSTELTSTDNTTSFSETTTSVTLTSEEITTLGSSEGTTYSATIGENTTLASTNEFTDSNVTELYSTTEPGTTVTDEVNTTSSYASTGSTSPEMNETSTTSGTGSTDFTTSNETSSTEESSESGITSTTEMENTTTTDETTSDYNATEYTGTTSSVIFNETEITTEETGIGSTTEGILIISTSQSTSDWFTSMRTKGVCKRRKRKCENTPFGCCPDKKTPASGPFDKNCTKPETCKDTKFGCCPDGVSPAKGNNNKGCPTEPCEDTLFGCCLSDNKTAANGNDQEGCPPACVASEFGCCADNETAAIGPHKKGCPETETTTTVIETETTTNETSTEETNTTITTESSTMESAENTTADTNTTSTAETGTTSSPDTNTTAETGSTSSSEGSTESGSTVISSCVASEFGCCYDNETAASGPEGQGCPCNATQFGCCPDGVAPAEGSQMEGCVESCNSSTHGCCPDGNTPAHGPNGEGCCLSTAFGCCPDNRKPAEGPRIEGCGCEYATYGCCPDKVTIARGPNNEGCGCQYTQHGCCPDRHTVATGPNFEGCSCLTYQFGCCDDGVTMAKGPEKQGCNCQLSEYGCCGDQKTPATEPGGGGCDCSTSRFGCCPDGHTEAAGPKFLGCTDIPVDKQAVCGLKADAGKCQNYTAMWYYDVEYGGCSRFWYGGCEGNNNKFATKEECDDICVHPAPKDACKLPSVKGSCSGDFVRWAYNSSREQCLPFRYGGCLGNDNNFETRDLCQSRCEPERSADQCSLPIEQGPCAGNFSHWGYNKETHRCEQFIWGGCMGNANRFSTEIACQMRCDPPGALKPQCTEPQDSGNCTSKQPLWSFSQGDDRCVPFYYTGCGGNDNKFVSQEDCEQTCPSSYVPDKCTLPASAGECANYRLKWFYDTGIKRCRQFYYGGCGGNLNNFETETECDNSCSEDKLYTTTTTIKPIPGPSSDVNEICLSSINAGPCTNFQTRYGYNSVLGRCVPFQYGGCAGNRNNFPDEETCSYHCHPVQDVCQLPMLEGPCTESVMRWFYDPSTDSCSQFTYGGCQGNDNRFESREACESRCKSSPVVTTTTTTVTTTLAPTPAIDSRIKDVLPECRVTPSYEECREPSVVWFLDPSRSECVAHINQERGNNCRYTATFHTQEGCERACGGFRGVDVCNQRVDPGPCDNYEVKVFFDQDNGRCTEFQYGGCHGGPNRFSTMEECIEVCKPQVEEDPCSLPPEGGNCVEYNPMWYYDRERDICGQFIYTGCGGNGNRFASEQDCQARCKEPVVPAPPEPAEECVTPDSLAPCGDNMTVFYYNSERQMCAVAENGNCNHPNSYSTEEECQRRCGEFKGIDVCTAPLDAGPCNAAILKYYWDVTTGSCQQFMYSGCSGGPNRFDNPEECETVCGIYKQAAACAAPVATGRACAGAAPRWHYSAAHRDCRAFAYLGCDGNDNNFLSYEHCADACLPLRRPGGPAAPQPLPPPEPQVTAVEGGVATLRCVFLGNPPPKITWRYREITIEGSFDRYRLTSDGALEIVSVYRNDSGVYVCIANNELGTAKQEIYLNVGDPNEVAPADCRAYEQECASVQCDGDIQQVATQDGCRRCVCASTSCDELQQQCAALICPYGLRRTQEGNCERCSCVEDPCDTVNCGIGQHCEAVAYADSQTNERRYTALCETDDVCAAYKQQCEKVSRTCRNTVQRSTDSNGCERCNCIIENPCLRENCAVGERCVVVSYRNFENALQNSTECRLINKPGQCPVDNEINVDVSCTRECNDDADCRGDGKCCVRGCSTVCALPESARPLTTTHAPDVPAPPQPLPVPEPQVSASEGGLATLRCLFHGNPPPKITWRRGELTIDGNVGRYRLTSDGALEIVSVYRNDTGVYICVADNGFGISKQEVHLIVNDPVVSAAGIAGDENAVVVGELDKPLEVKCLAYGYPEPSVYWYRSDGSLVPFNNALFRARMNSLLIRRLTLDTLGEYTCQAYNGQDKAVSWAVVVQAYHPEGIILESEYLVSRHPSQAVNPVPAPTTRDTTTTTTTTTEVPPPLFTVPVSARISTPIHTLNIGAELRLTCEVDGFPDPEVTWSKDGSRVVPNERTVQSGNAGFFRLSISRVEVSDSGQYTCHVYNTYSTASDSVVMHVQQMMVPAKCTDNPFFANCDLIVRSKFCRHKYYSKFCCKSCVEAGQLDPEEAALQADQPFRRK